MHEKNKETAKPDFIAAVVLIALSVAILVISFNMPTYVRHGLYATPALSPLIFAVLLLVCSVILLARSLRYRGYIIRITGDMISCFVKSRQVHNFFAALGLVLIYAFFIGKLHFAVVSALYLFLNMLYFRSTSLWKNGAISILTSVSIWYCFDSLFLIPLP
ncbi:MAG: tripartite tricarboxylate transporter TctB family protein [Propionivibrio sp.]